MSEMKFLSNFYILVSKTTDFQMKLSSRQFRRQQHSDALNRSRKKNIKIENVVSGRVEFIAHLFNLLCDKLK